MSPECVFVWPALLLLSLALLVSLCLNLMFCLLRHKRSAQKGQKTSKHSKSLPQTEEAYPEDTNNCAPDEDSHSLPLEQENPIYGNIITDGTGSVVFYEAMTVRARERIQVQPSESDLNYASLDLKLAMKRKRRHQQGLVPGPVSPEQLQGRLTPPGNVFLGEACLPLRDHSPMLSHSSIYLNSQQLGQDREDREDRDHWQKTRDERTQVWSPESEGHVCCEDGRLTDEQTVQTEMDHLFSSDRDK